MNRNHSGRGHRNSSLFTFHCSLFIFSGRRGAGPYRKKSLRPPLGRKPSFRGTTHIRLFAKPHFQRCNARRTPGIGRSSRANQAPPAQRAFSRRPSFSVRWFECYFPDHSRLRLSHIAQFFKDFFGLFVKEGFDGRAPGDYNEHRMANSGAVKSFLVFRQAVLMITAPGA